MTFKDIAGKINLMPIRGLAIYHVNIDGDGVTRFYQLEAESAFQMEPIIRTTHEGIDITLGYKLNANIYVPHNLYKTDGLLERVETLVQGIGKGTLINQVVLMLGKSVIAQDQDGAPDAINSTGKLAIEFGTTSIDGTTVNKLSSFSYKLETIELRPRMIINVRAFIKDPLKSWTGEMMMGNY
jgi:hypothetical protein